MNIITYPRGQGQPSLPPLAAWRGIFKLFSGLLLLLCCCSHPARADQLVLLLDLHQAGAAADGNLGFYAFAFLNTTNSPITYHQVYSPGTNGTITGGAGPGSSTYGVAYGSLDDMLNAFTNGLWRLVLNVGDPSEQTYYFGMSAPSFTSNTFPAVHVTFPPDGALDVPNNPVFTWTTTSTFAELDVNENGKYQDFGTGATLDQTATNWNPGSLLNQGAFTIDVTYVNTNAPTAMLITTPTNSLGQTPPGWVTTNRLFADDSHQFTVGIADTSGTAHLLVAHYPWDATNSDGTASGADTSGNAYDLNVGGSFGSQGGVNASTDAAVGDRSIQFIDGDGNSGGHVGWSPMPAALLNALAGSFSVSCWIKTTQGSFGWDTGPAFYGAGILTADNGGQANDVIPLALTGSKLGFGTGGDSDATVNSATTVNDGNYHHVVVTRNQVTGQKIIYVDGMFDSFSSGSTNLLNDPLRLTIGSLADARDSDPVNGFVYNGYDGLLDDLQIYSGVLSSNDVAYLFNNPGATVNNQTDFNATLGTTGLDWVTSGDAPWFTESTNTYSGAPLAAQSGSVTNSQNSALSVTVTGPGTLTFAWSSIANDPNSGFDYEFDIDGSYYNDIYGDTDWFQDGPYAIGPGTHTLSWTTYAYGDTDPTQAGFLDAVNFTQNTAPTITLNPFNQTNYPGYSVALLAAATSNVAVTWQWFKVGSGSPIPNATNGLFIPTNSGSAGVAGSYYAVASTGGGSANSSTATVSFVSAPLPPDWARAFKSPSFNNNAAGSEYFQASLADSAGNLLVAGSFNGTNTIGAQTYYSANGTVEILKLTPTGTALWSVVITNVGTGNGQSEAVAPAPGDGLYVLGNFSGTNVLGTNVLRDTGGFSIFLARLDANGNVLWVRTITSQTNFIFTGFNCLVADPAGTVTLSGLVSGWTTFSSTNAATSTNLLADGQLGALAQYDANGRLLWAEQPGAWPLNMAYSAGRIYASMFTPAAGFTGLTNSTDRRFTLAALDPATGQAIWLRGLGAPQPNGNPLGIIADIPLISVYGTNLTVVGTAFGNSAAFGPYTVSWPGAAGQYFARYDTNGNPQLATSFGSPTTLLWASLPDPSGNLYVAGDFDTFTSFGNDLLAAPHLGSIGNGYYSAAFVAKFDRNGNPLWARPVLPQTGLANLRTLVPAPSGVWASGIIQSPTAFGTNLVFSSLTCIGSPFCTLTYYTSGAFGQINDLTALPLPVTLLSPQDNGAQFQCQFLSQSGFTHDVQWRTNLVTGQNWQTYSSVAGDGTLKTIPIPLSVFSPSRQGFVRVATH